MKFFRLDLLTLLISLFILNSCKNQDTIGLGVDATNQINGALVDTSTIIVNTVKDDSLVTSGITKAPLGYFHDPIFGQTEANLALSVTLPTSSGYVLPSGTITIDSTRLIMHYADGFYGDSVASSYKVNLYQLSELFNEQSAYFQNKQWQTNPALLGSVTFKARTHDSIKVNNIIKGKPDSIVKAGPQLRLPVNNSFIISNFFNASSATLASNTVFQSIFKGLYLTIDKDKTTGPGGTFMFSNVDTLAVFCKVTNNGEIDTTTINLLVTKLAASITHTYSATINAELANTTTSGSVFYLQGLSGLRTKIKFPNLLANLRNSLLKRDSDIVLNRAELVITPKPGSAIPYRALPRLTMYKLDIAHQRISIEDASSVDPRAVAVTSFGYYIAKTNDYHFIVTAYLQDLLLKRTVDYGTYIAPVDVDTVNTTSLNISPTPSVGGRTVAVGSDKTSGFQIKLNVIYTKIAK